MMNRILGFLFLPLVLVACATLSGKETGGSAPSASSTKASSSNGETAAAKFAVNDQTLDPRGIDYAKAPESIAFGCCADQNDPQPIWKTIVSADPDLFLFLGNEIENSKSKSATAGSLAEQYRKLNRIPEYREARQKIPFMAITQHTPRKDFLGYWSYVKDSIPYHRDGIYHAKMIGGLVTGRKRKRVTGPTLQVILLDTKSFRSPLKKVDNPEHPELAQYAAQTDRSLTVLGETQWEWLEEQLRKPAQLRLIVSPIPILSSTMTQENWAAFPNERERFFQLLKKTSAHNLVLLTGEQQVGGIFKTEVKGHGTVYEMTAGPLNDPQDGTPEKGKEALGDLYTKENFGFLKIDWTHKKIKADIRDLAGKNVQTLDLKLR